MERPTWQRSLKETLDRRGVPADDPRRTAAHEQMNLLANEAKITYFLPALAVNVANNAASEESDDKAH